METLTPARLIELGFRQMNLVYFEHDNKIRVIQKGSDFHLLAHSQFLFSTEQRLKELCLVITEVEL